MKTLWLLVRLILATPFLVWAFGAPVCGGLLVGAAIERLLGMGWFAQGIAGLVGTFVGLLWFAVVVEGHWGRFVLAVFRLDI